MKFTNSVGVAGSALKTILMLLSETFRSFLLLISSKSTDSKLLIGKSSPLNWTSRESVRYNWSSVCFAEMSW